MNSIRIDGVWKIKEIVEYDVTLARTFKEVRQQLTDYERKFLKSADEYLVFEYEHGELVLCRVRPETSDEKIDRETRLALQEKKAAEKLERKRERLKAALAKCELEAALAKRELKAAFGECEPEEAPTKSEMKAALTKCDREAARTKSELEAALAECKRQQDDPSRSNSV